jgi:hypothetical protein
MAVNERHVSRGDEMFDAQPLRSRGGRRNTMTRALLALVVALAAALIAVLARPQHDTRRAVTPPTTQTPTPTQTAEPSPRGLAAGVPVGYPDTRDGARAAAANYTIAYGSDAMFNTDKRHAILNAIAER